MHKKSGCFVSENQLVQVTKQLAERERSLLKEKGISGEEDIAGFYELSLRRAILPKKEDGALEEANSTIILNSCITSPERLKFTFYHELMHYLIRHDDDLLSLVHETYKGDSLSESQNGAR